MPGRLGRGVRAATKTVDLTVALGQTVGTAPLPPNTKEIVSLLPAGNQDQFVDKAEVVNGVVTVTLAAAATAANTFKVVCV